MVIVGLLIASLSSKLALDRAILLSAIVFAAGRTVFFAYTHLVDTRFVVPAVPALELAAVVGLVALWRRRKSTPANGAEPYQQW